MHMLMFDATNLLYVALGIGSLLIAFAVSKYQIKRWFFPR